MNYTNISQQVGNILLNYSISKDLRTIAAPLMLSYEDIGNSKGLLNQNINDPISAFLYRHAKIGDLDLYKRAVTIAVYYIAMRVLLKRGPISVTKNLMFAQISTKLVVQLCRKSPIEHKAQIKEPNEILSKIIGRILFSPYQNAFYIYVAKVNSNVILDSLQHCGRISSKEKKVTQAVVALASIYFMENIIITPNLVNTWALCEVSALALNTILNQVNPQRD